MCATSTLSGCSPSSLELSLFYWDSISVRPVVSLLLYTVSGILFEYPPFSGATPQCIAPLVIGCILLILASVNELLLKTRSPIVPPRLFKVCQASSYTVMTFSSFSRPGPLRSSSFLSSSTPSASSVEHTIFQYIIKLWAPLQPMLVSGALQVLSMARSILCYETVRTSGCYHSLLALL